MADQERAILDFYQLSTPFPSEWPKEKDDDNSSADEAETSRKATNTNLQRRKSQYQALERATSTRRRSSYMPGADGRSLVQKDEPDPMGSTESVVRSLKAMGLPLQDDARLRKLMLLPLHQDIN